MYLQPIKIFEIKIKAYLIRKKEKEIVIRKKIFPFKY